MVLIVVALSILKPAVKYSRSLPLAFQPTSENRYNKYAEWKITGVSLRGADTTADFIVSQQTATYGVPLV